MLAKLEKLLNQRDINIFELVSAQNKLLRLSYDLMRNPSTLELSRQADEKEFQQFIDDIVKQNQIINQRIAATAIYEPKTGLLNIGSFDTLLEAHFSLCRKGQCDDLVEAIFDIDFFKRVNEKYSYLVADRALIQVVNIIAGNLRRPDVMTPFEQAMQLLEGYATAIDRLKEFMEKKAEISDKYRFSFVSIGGMFSSANTSVIYEIVKNYINSSETDEGLRQKLPAASTEAYVFDFATRLRYEEAGRFGGEEIVVVFPDTSVQAGYEKCDCIRRNIEQYFREYPLRDEAEGIVTVSGGVQSYKELMHFNDLLDRYRNVKSSLTKEELFAEANLALSVAKQTGRNNVLTFRDALTQLSRSDTEIDREDILKRLKIEGYDATHVLTEILRSSA